MAHKQIKLPCHGAIFDALLRSKPAGERTLLDPRDMIVSRRERRKALMRTVPPASHRKSYLQTREV